jgi:hypothetical protein
VHVGLGEWGAAVSLLPPSERFEDFRVTRNAIEMRPCSRVKVV